MLDVKQIQKLLPHRYPFLLVDRVLEVTADSITAIKNVTVNEEFFNGHFPNQPIMPGVLQIEALAQVAGIYALSQPAAPQDVTTLFAGVDGVKWKKPVLPGDQLKLTVKIVKMRNPLIICQGTASVNEETVCEVAEMKMMILKQP
ncbi:3-hydroxyacyl-ACP dehydratase [Candidatus Termititenax persephonae]|uniref:3-hydroxyacyl-[acyl-carrier-protein] dehydratase FabZ n=1 Tax=Candidatus Termititenax persephonae TaxID=2218525 RepID=A0A388THX5_9BACT|nr:3-hydroxyacyl-ACP dehydratase [Candidatus Termititenax persephonae]